jgi:hypothetical protein
LKNWRVPTLAAGLKRAKELMPGGTPDVLPLVAASADPVSSNMLSAVKLPALSGVAVLLLCSAMICSPAVPRPKLESLSHVYDGWMYVFPARTNVKMKPAGTLAVRVSEKMPSSWPVRNAPVAVLKPQSVK